MNILQNIEQHILVAVIESFGVSVNFLNSFQNNDSSVSFKSFSKNSSLLLSTEYIIFKV